MITITGEKNENIASVPGAPTPAREEENVPSSPAEAPSAAPQSSEDMLNKLRAAEQKLLENEEKWRLRKKQADLTAALLDRLTPACGKDLAAELSRMMCAGADLSALSVDEEGACDPAGLTNAVEKLRAAWPACFAPRPRLQGIETVTPPLPAETYEPRELTDDEYYSRIYKK